MKKIFGYIIIFLLYSGLARAAFNAGTDSPFEMGAGAKHLALGGAFISGCSDAMAPYWNPSGLSTTEKISLTGFHTNLYESDVAYQYLGLVFPTIDWGTLGVGIYRLGVDGIEKRDAGNLLLGEVSDTRLAFYLAYGKRVRQFDVGLSFCMEQHSLDKFKATSSPGLTLSMGRSFLFSNGFMEELSFSINGRNIVQPSIKLDISEVKYPSVLDISATLRTNLISDWNSPANLYVSADKVESIDWTVSAGLEYMLLDILAIRGGLNENRLSFGVGINIKFIEFDYALVDRDMGSLHMFSLTTSFGSPIAERRQMRAKRMEERFQQLMSSQFAEKNKNMVQKLVDQGKDYLDRDDFEKAVNSFEKAVFVARSNDIDTTAIYPLLSDARNRLEDMYHERLYVEYLDSAQVKFEGRDYLAAKYFAGLAVKEKPNSSQAKKIISSSDRSLAGIASIDAMINNKLMQYDSLMSYNLLHEAMVIIRSLEEVAPDNIRVKLASKRLEFESIKNAAQNAFDIFDFETCLARLDSALALFPGHKWCLNLKSRAIQEANEYGIISEPLATADQSPVVSEQVKREVEESYNTAMKLFRDGRLNEAVTYWEKVEHLIPDYKSGRQYLIKAYKYIGVELYGQNRLKEAIAIWMKAIKLDPQNKEISDYIIRSENEIRKLEELSYGE